MGFDFLFSQITLGRNIVVEGIGIELLLRSRRRGGLIESYVFLPTVSPPVISVGQLQKDANC